MPDERADPALPDLRRVIPGQTPRQPSWLVNRASNGGEQGRQQGHGEQHGHGDDHQSSEADAPGIDERGEQQGAQPHCHGESGRDDRTAGGEEGPFRRFAPPEPAVQLLAKPGDDEQRVIDADAEADHAGEVEHEDRHRGDPRDFADDGERERDGDDAHHDRQQGRDQRPEGQHQDGEGDRQHAELEPAAVVRAHGPDVELEGSAARHLQ